MNYEPSTSVTSVIFIERISIFSFSFSQQLIDGNISKFWNCRLCCFHRRHLFLSTFQCLCRSLLLGDEDRFASCKFLRLLFLQQLF